MELNTMIILSVITIIILIIISHFNTLNKKSNQIQNAISSLDALFIKRNELIPNLISIVKKYMDYEKDTLDHIVKLRTQDKNNTYLNDSENVIAMKQLMVQIENYPELKADNQFGMLQYSYNECEEHIAAGRRFLSSSITDYNNSVATFPSNLIAMTFNFKKHEWEHATASQRVSPNIESLLN